MGKFVPTRKLLYFVLAIFLFSLATPIATKAESSDCRNLAASFASTPDELTLSELSSLAQCLITELRSRIVTARSEIFPIPNWRQRDNPPIVIPMFPMVIIPFSPRYIP